MTVRSFKPALRPSKGYVCLACRLEKSHPNRQIRRLQHTTTQPPNPDAEPLSLSVDRVSSKHQEQAGESTTAPNQEPEDQPRNDRPSRPAAQDLNPKGPTAEARKLQLLLHQKFVAQRRKDAASMPLAEDLELGSSFRGSKTKRRKQEKTEIPVKEVTRTAPRRRAGPRQRAARARRQALKVSVGPRSMRKEYPTPSAQTGSASVVASKAETGEKDGKRSGGVNSSDKPVGMEQSTDVGKRSRFSSAQDGASQPQTKTIPFLERLKDSLRSFTTGEKAGQSFRHVPLSAPSQSDKSAPFLVETLTSPSQHESGPTASKKSMKQLLQAMSPPSQHQSGPAAGEEESSEKRQLQSRSALPQHQSEPTATEKLSDPLRNRPEPAAKKVPKLRQTSVPSKDFVSNGRTAAPNAKSGADTSLPRVVPDRKLEAGKVVSRPTLRKVLSATPIEVIRKVQKSKDKGIRTKRARDSKSIHATPVGPTQRKVQKSKDTGTRLKHARDIQIIHAYQLSITALGLEQPPVPRLSYGLERVLFNPGVYYLQDPRSRVYNFDPYLQTIMPAKEFDFNALKEYITSSRDQALRELADTYKKRYVGSSSSMTGTLAHFHFLLSQWRPINTNMLSREFPEQHVTEFTELQRSPSAIFLKWRNGSYAIDADKEFASANILMMLGKSMEKLLTLDTQDFEKYRKSNPDTVPEEERKAPEAYHYSTMGDFIMRSQLDAQDPRLPGTGMFDLKTRAVVSVRMEASNYEQGSGYQIKSRQGAWESFEREYFDMIRSAFLKYSLQVRMGRMDGIFVAFHNTDRIFGFQYVSLAEMDSTLHGQWDTNLGDQEFKFSVALLNEVLDKATKKYPNTSLRLHFETRKARTNFMYIFAEPVTEEQIEAIQTAKNAEIQKFEDELYGGRKDSDEDDGDSQSWENLEANVQNAMDDDIRDPHHDEGRQDRSLTVADSEQDDLKCDDSASTHDIGDEGENGESMIIGNNEDADEGLNQDKEIGEDDVPEIAIEDPEVESEDDEANDDESEKTELDGGPGQDAQHPALDGSSNVHETGGPDFLTGDTESSEDTPGNHTESQSRIETSELEPLSEKSNSQVGGQEVLALTLTIRNKIDGRDVLRPNALRPNQQWSIEYSLDEVPNTERAWSLYQACQLRRKKKLDNDKERSENDEEVDGYIQRLRQMSRKGAKWRKQQDEQEKELPLKILGADVQAQERLINRGD
ncbi:MAG: hypothetical protein Q9208_005108 [Pyrenodesmia sp. 3 TL-2023]